MPDPSELPLAGVRVLDFSQFLAGPVAALRLADLGADVVKVERPLHGEIGRTLAFAGRYVDGDTLSFHAMNRGKRSVVADLKDETDLGRVRELTTRADVLLQNFRPGVMERIGLDYATVRELNPRLVYASASGYGSQGPWRARPGQDLLAQSLAALPWHNGPGDRPVPVGLSLADHLMSCHLAQGVTALLVRRERTGRGGLVETSLLEGMLDLQFEVLTHRLNGALPPPPAGTLLRAADGYLAVAARVEVLTELHLDASTRTREDLRSLLDEHDIPHAPLLTLEELLASDEFPATAMTQAVERPHATHPEREPVTVRTTSTPLRIDGKRPKTPAAAPRLGDSPVELLLDAWASRTNGSLECRYANPG